MMRPTRAGVYCPATYPRPVTCQRERPSLSPPPAPHADPRRRRRELDRVGRASVYRTLEQLEELGLVQRVDLGGESAAYERVDPTGHHHHHLVCTTCGKVVPFEDSGLERAIHAVNTSDGFEVEAHEVTLRGTCERCR